MQYLIDMLENLVYNINIVNIIEVMNMVNLREMRVQAGITQIELAEAADTSQSWISAIERGERQPTIRQAKRIGAVLGFDWWVFFEGEDDGGQGAIND